MSPARRSSPPPFLTVSGTTPTSSLRVARPTARDIKIARVKSLCSKREVAHKRIVGIDRILLEVAWS